MFIARYEHTEKIVASPVLTAVPFNNSHIKAQTHRMTQPGPDRRFQLKFIANVTTFSIL